MLPIGLYPAAQLITFANETDLWQGLCMFSDRGIKREFRENFRELFHSEGMHFP